VVLEVSLAEGEWVTEDDILTVWEPLTEGGILQEVVSLRDDDMGCVRVVVGADAVVDGVWDGDEVEVMGSELVFDTVLDSDSEWLPETDPVVEDVKGGDSDDDFEGDCVVLEVSVGDIVSVWHTQPGKYPVTREERGGQSARVQRLRSHRKHRASLAFVIPQPLDHRSFIKPLFNKMMSVSGSVPSPQ
jgi:hypothetical protein